VECNGTLQGGSLKNGTKGVREVQVRLSGCTGGQIGEGGTGCEQTTCIQGGYGSIQSQKVGGEDEDSIRLQ
jgi:hypothetical protein